VASLLASKFVERTTRLGLSGCVAHHGQNRLVERGSSTLCYVTAHRRMTIGNKMSAASGSPVLPGSPWRQLSRYQLLVLLIAWLGWIFDSMDATIYNLVLTPALREPLPTSTGTAASSLPYSLLPGLLAALYSASSPIALADREPWSSPFSFTRSLPGSPGWRIPGGNSHFAVF